MSQTEARIIQTMSSVFVSELEFLGLWAAAQHSEPTAEQKWWQLLADNSVQKKIVDGKVLVLAHQTVETFSDQPATTTMTKHDHDTFTDTDTVTETEHDTDTQHDTDTEHDKDAEFRRPLIKRSVDHIEMDWWELAGGASARQVRARALASE